MNWVFVNKIQALALRNNCTFHLKRHWVYFLLAWYLKSNCSQFLPLPSDDENFKICQENN